MALICNFFVIVYTDLFVSSLFPSERIPWAAWNNRGQLFKNMWKMMLIYSDIIFSESYLTLCHVLALGVLLACIYERMIKATDTTLSPWYRVMADDKRSARLNCISHLLSQIPYQDIPFELPPLPERRDRPADAPDSLEFKHTVPEVF